MPSHSTGHGFVIAAAGPETLADRCKRLEGNCAAYRNRLLDAKAELILAAQALLSPDRAVRDAAEERVAEYVGSM